MLYILASSCGDLSYTKGFATFNAHDRCLTSALGEQLLEYNSFWDKEAPEFSLFIEKEGILPDFFQLLELSVASQRFIDVLTKYNVPFQLFNCTIVSREGKEVTDAYKVVHLLDYTQVIDWEKTEHIEESTYNSDETFIAYYRNPVAREDFLTSNFMVVRDITSKVRPNIIVRQEIKDAILTMGLTGCVFYEFEQLTHGSVSKLRPQHDPIPPIYRMLNTVSHEDELFSEISLVSPKHKDKDEIMDFAIRWTASFDQPWHDQALTFVFEIEPPYVMADYICCWPDFYIISEPLIALWQSYNVPLQLFDCTIVTEKGEIFSEQTYKVFRLLRISEVIDVERSEFRGISEFRNLVPNENFLQSSHVMARDNYFPTFIFVKEEMKQKMEALGLRGIRFQPMDIMESWLYDEGPLHPVATNEPTLQANAINDEYAEAIREGIKDSLEYLELNADNNAMDIVKAIENAVLSIRTANPSEDFIISASTKLGCLWGEQVRRHYQWRWRMVSSSTENATLAITPTDNAYMVMPMICVKTLIDNPKKPLNLILLFNMLQDNSLPKPRTANALVTIG